ncbi:beta-defensin 4A-like [Trachemys scripta elegans]|uniref:beta-defensin 4A-like n=1 Tax=Trachemys scripta elegans TaxID=31138 RepID=UPI001555CA68|nr:beta-defensin 4A-like [Trachemys scripta elegans]
MKILYLLFAVFFLVLQSFPGFTRSDPKNIKECLKAGGICFPFGCPFSKRIGRCSPGVRCCKKKVSFLDIGSGYERPAVLRLRGVGGICCESLW